MFAHDRKRTPMTTHAALWRNVAIISVLPVVSDREASD
jgi:hypothetical protein